MSQTLNKITPASIQHYASVGKGVGIPPSGKNDKRRVSALERAIGKTPTRKCELLKPNVSCEKKTYQKIKEIAHKVQLKLKGKPSTPERTIHPSRTHSFLSNAFRAAPSSGGRKLMKGKKHMLFDSPSDQPTFRRNDDLSDGGAH